MTVNGYLFAGYTVVWTILFIYLVFLNRKQKQVAKELKNLNEAIERQRSR